MTISTSSVKRKPNLKKFLYKLCAVAFWIIVWEALARAVGSDLIICSPIVAFKRLLELIVTPEFRNAIAFSSLRILSGFFAALILGIFLAALSSRVAIIKALLEPITSVIKATPVASFIILAIIWFGSRNLSMFISFLMVFPVIYLNVLEGIESADRGLIEMAKVFRLGGFKTLTYVYFPQLLPFLISGCSVALGLCWKSGIAAEVIGISTGSVGERLYRAKLYFETGDLLAWTAVIIIVSTVFEKLFMLLLRLLKNKVEGVRR